MSKTVTVDKVAPVGAQNMKSVLGIIAGIAALVVVMILPTPAGMTPEAQRTAALFAFGLVLWSMEALPIAVTCPIVIARWPALGCR